MPFKDREERLEYHREYNKKLYAKHRDYYLQKSKRRKKEIYAWYQELKRNLKCNRCPETHFACLEFHHTDAKVEKKLSISRMARQGVCKKRILEEIAKCEVLCANCHRKEHNGEVA